MPLPVGVTEERAVQSTLGSFFNLPNPNPKKRPLYPSTLIAGPSTSSSRMEDEKSKLKKAKTSEGSKGKAKEKDALTQMYLTHLPLVHTCSQCLMSYVRGGEDQSLHERHHARVTRGIIWEGLGRSKGKGKGKERGEGECGWRVVKDNVPYGPQGKGRGRIIVADGSYGGAKVCPCPSYPDSLLVRPGTKLTGSWTTSSKQSIQYSHPPPSPSPSWTIARSSYLQLPLQLLPSEFDQ
jgi:N-acetyltransferase